MPRCLLPTGSYDRPAILRAAWAKAHFAASMSGKRCQPFTYPVTTARAAFGQALREVWAQARTERAYAVWAAGQDANRAAEAARRAALPDRDRAIEDARTELLMAEMNDTVSSHRLVAAAYAQLASLQHHA